MHHPDWLAGRRGRECPASGRMAGREWAPPQEEYGMSASAHRRTDSGPPAGESPAAALPDGVRDVEHLEDLLSEPSPGVIDTLSRLQGDVILLGVGGKMGPSLARMTRRASDAAGVKRRVMGVSRFGAGGGSLPTQLHGWGVEA